MFISPIMWYSNVCVCAHVCAHCEGSGEESRQVIIAELRCGILKGVSQIKKAIKLGQFSPICEWVGWTPEISVIFSEQNGWNELVRVNTAYLPDYQPPLNLMLYQFSLNQLLWKCSRFPWSQLDDVLLQVIVYTCSASGTPSYVFITTLSLVPLPPQHTVRALRK